MSDRATALHTVRTALADADLVWKEIAEGSFTVELPGEKKLQKPCRLDVREHALGVHAFVARAPDGNNGRVYRWFLERNLRLFGVSCAVDHLGEIYLVGRLPLAAVTPDE